MRKQTKKKVNEDFPGGTVDKNLPANAEDASVSRDSGRFHVPSNNEACAPHLLRPACSRAASCRLLKPIHLEPVPHQQEKPVQ